MDEGALAALVLPGTDDASHRLGDLWGDRAIVLVFLRHFG
jgi:hypothetical protein